MNHSRNALFLLVFVVLPFLSHAAAGPPPAAESPGDPIVLAIPVRVLSGSESVAGLKADDFALRINSRVREIVSFGEGQACLGQTAHLGRSIIISFQLRSFVPAVSREIDQLVTQVLTPADHLIIMTPFNVSSLEVTVNKEALIQAIEDLLRRDLLEFNRHCVAAEKSLEMKIAKMRRIFGEESHDASWNVYRYKEAIQFLNTFPQAFADFKERYLVPHGNRYAQIADLLGDRGGERWWIHFVSRELTTVLPRIRQVVSLLKGWENLATAHLPYDQGFDHLEKELLLSDLFSVDEAAKTLVGRQIRYSTIFCTGQRRTSDSGGDWADLEVLFTEMAARTGGQLVVPDGPKSGVSRLMEFCDRFYELGFVFNGLIEDKHFLVQVAAQHMKPVYLADWAVEEVRFHLDHANRVEVSVEGVAVTEGTLKFSIMNYQQDTAEGFGILRVVVECFEPDGRRSYKTENTLRTFKNNVGISLPLPGPLGEGRKLKITVVDLIANAQIEVEHGSGIR